MPEALADVLLLRQVSVQCIVMQQLGNDFDNNPLLLHLLSIANREKTGFLIVGLVRFFIMMMMNWVGLS